MLNKIIFVIIFVAVVSAGIAGMVFLANKGSSDIAPAKLEMASLTDPHLPSQEEKSRLNLTEPPKKIPQSITMETDYFTFVLPLSWTKSSEGYTLPIIIVDTLEEITDEKAKEIDFRTGLSINSMPLGETSLKDYVEKVKTSLIQAIPIIEITKEEQADINGSNVHIVEIVSIQQDIKFMTVLAIFAGKDNTVWAFSFNTIEEAWPYYKPIFYRTAQSVKMK